MDEKMRLIKLRPVLKEIIWGGNRLSEEYNLGSPGDKIAEAWMLCMSPEGESVIEGGNLDGTLLSEAFGGYYAGMSVAFKLIDAASDLSVQVHPSKTEMWYVLDCEPGARLVSGLSSGYDREEFVKSAKDGTVGRYLRYVPVKKGDVFFIPRGLVHAIGGGITLAEIQQNSNVTYRVYDYGRVGKDGRPRELHLDAAADTVTDISPSETDAARYSVSRGRIPGEEKLIVDCEYFRVRERTVPEGGTARLRPDGKFLSVICVGGEGRISRRIIKKGDSFLLPKGCVATVRADCDLRLILTDQ